MLTFLFCSVYLPGCEESPECLSGNDGYCGLLSPFSFSLFLSLSFLIYLTPNIRISFPQPVFR